MVVSNLRWLLRERDISRYRLAELTGLMYGSIWRMARPHVVDRIDCKVAVKICLVLSRIPRTRDHRRIQVRLDQMFPFEKRSGK